MDEYKTATYRGQTITLERFKQGWTAQWYEGNTPYMSTCWRSSQAALNHAKKAVDRYLRTNGRSEHKATGLHA